MSTTSSDTKKKTSWGALAGTGVTGVIIGVAACLFAKDCGGASSYSGVKIDSSMNVTWRPQMAHLIVPRFMVLEKPCPSEDKKQEPEKSQQPSKSVSTAAKTQPRSGSPFGGLRLEDLGNGQYRGFLAETSTSRTPLPGTRSFEGKKEVIVPQICGQKLNPPYTHPPECLSYLRVCEYRSGELVPRNCNPKLIE